jgi:hypothetical protein
VSSSACICKNNQINHNNANNEHQRKNYFSEFSNQFNYNNENNLRVLFCFAPARCPGRAGAGAFLTT